MAMAPTTMYSSLYCCHPNLHTSIQGMRGIRRKIALNHSRPVPSAGPSLQARCHHGAILWQHIPVHSSVRLALLGSAHDGGAAPGHGPHQHPRTNQSYPAVAHPYWHV